MCVRVCVYVYVCVRVYVVGWVFALLLPYSGPNPTSSSPHDISLTWRHLHESVPVEICPITELTIVADTRGQHSPVCLQHHAVSTACGNRLGACVREVEVS